MTNQTPPPPRGLPKSLRARWAEVYQLPPVKVEPDEQCAVRDCPHLRVYPKTPLCERHYQLAMAYWGPQSRALAGAGIKIAPPTGGRGRRGSSQDAMLAEMGFDPRTGKLLK